MQRRLHLSVTEMRKYVIGRLNWSVQLRGRQIDRFKRHAFEVSIAPTLSP